MDRLADLKLRRLPALLLFFILGPAVLLTVFGLVVYRRSGGSRTDEAAALSQVFRLRTELTDAEFVRPGTKTYFGLRLCASRTDAPFLFCPEILVRSVNEQQADRDVPKYLEELGVTESEFLQRSFSDSKNGERKEWLIPDLYLKVSEWKNAEAFFNGTAGDFPNGGITFRVGRVHLIPSDKLFDQISSSYERPRHRFGSDIIEDLAEIGNGSAGASRVTVSVLDEVQHYTSNQDEAILGEVRMTWHRAGTENLARIEFKFEGITAASPALLTLFQRNVPAEATSDDLKKKCSLYRQFNCMGTPAPTQTLASFVPALAAWGESCWLTGEINAGPDKDGTDRVDIQNMTLHDASLASLLKNVTTTRIEGDLSKLVIGNGKISGGVFLGEGKVQLVNARFLKDFLVRFQKEFDLNFRPSNTLINKFPNDMVPFDRIMFDYTFQKDGVCIKASDSNQSGLAGTSNSTALRYQFYLPTQYEKTVPYSQLLATLADADENRFWSPFYRDAMNHLPVVPNDTIKVDDALE